MNERRFPPISSITQESSSPRNGTIRCAIYTRKSTDEGLDQEFNSLDAQRESAEAYIASQRPEGWTYLPGRYDDGGFTGGNMQRHGHTDASARPGGKPRAPPPPPQLVPESATVGTWGAVYGELLSFDDPESRLPAIDRLEGFTRAVTACTAACCKEDTAVI